MLIAARHRGYLASYINKAKFPSLHAYPTFFNVGENADDRKAFSMADSIPVVQRQITQAFLRGGSMQTLAGAIGSQFGQLDASALTVFGDNHDQPRMRNAASGDVSRVANAIVFVCMTEGVPVI